MVINGNNLYLAMRERVSKRIGIERGLGKLAKDTQRDIVSGKQALDFTPRNTG